MNGDPIDGSFQIPGGDGFMFGGAGPSGSESRETSDHYAEGIQIASWWLKARRMREDMFGPGLFADPAWDILLDLYTAEARGENVQISSLAIAARVPHSTAIRWAKIMTRVGLVEREKDPRDARRIHVRLSPSARSLMEDYLARLNQQGQVPPSILAGTPR